MHKNATKCNETLNKWCKNKYGASKIMDTLETYQKSSSVAPCISNFGSAPCKVSFDASSGNPTHGGERGHRLRLKTLQASPVDKWISSFSISTAPPRLSLVDRRCAAPPHHSRCTTSSTKSAHHHAVPRRPPPFRGVVPSRWAVPRPHRYHVAHEVFGDLPRPWTPMTRLCSPL
jgi:hypothetical protein